MDEKITFEDLVDTIAEKSNQSKSFTKDFLADLSDQIKTGLKNKGKVNIAGFGKFELQQVEEREGYNPQTDEKITIPAHKKAVFKPYKALREPVNAPYAHFEPQLIESDKPQKDEPYFPVEPSEKKNKKESSASDTKNYLGWIGAGVAFMTASVSAWFYLKKDK